MSFLSLRDKGNVGFVGTWQWTFNDVEPKVTVNIGYSTWESEIQSER